VIERWLQITCDECGETDNSTWPNLTLREFRQDLGKLFVKRGGRDLCAECAKKERDANRVQGRALPDP
jgi:hypothetical protein